VNRFSKTAIGKPAQWLIDAAASIGLDFAGLTHEVTNYFVNHDIKKHGNAKTEKARGQLAVTPVDIERISDIVKNPDYAIIGIKRNSEKLIAYSKQCGEGTFIYYEEVLNSSKNKALRSKTMYKKMGAVGNETFLRIVANNAHIDMSGAKMVVGAGGHPGGEAD
jgi:hypothetical protein